MLNINNSIRLSPINKKVNAHKTNVYINSIVNALLKIIFSSNVFILYILILIKDNQTNLINK